jgi:hypothetical protein
MTAIDAPVQTETDLGEEDVEHIYPRPPGPGSVAYCGHLWTPEEAQQIWHGSVRLDCPDCMKARPRS